MRQLQLERLAAAGIQLLPLSHIPTHYVFEGAGFAALVARTPEGFGSVGSAGLLTEGGFAALIWRGGQPFFVRKGVELPASAAQVEALHAFASDLEQALRAD
ncbi:MAG: hypothetical protein ABSE56_01595 [Bryobacteraceae bacterium]|jgi:hypothetical protein